MKFDSDHIKLLRGKLISGRGLATGQLAEIMKLMNFNYKLVPGSLNLIFDEPIAFETKKTDEFVIFQTSRYFWKAKINDLDVLLYRWRGSRLHIIEVLAPLNIREHFNLQDGDKIDIQVSKKYLRPRRLIETVMFYIFWSFGRQSWPYKTDKYQYFTKYIEAAFGTIQK